MAKWKNVSTFVMASGFSHHVRNNPTSKDKWIIVIIASNSTKTAITIVIVLVNLSVAFNPLDHQLLRSQVA
jgi:hypothetical protein